MILLLAGLWALVFGRITLTRSLKLSGRVARYYGLSLLVACVVMTQLVPYLHIPEPKGDEDVQGYIVWLAINVAINIAVLVAFALAFLRFRAPKNR